MRILAKVVVLPCLCLTLASTASAATVTAKFVSGQTALSNAQIVAYLSFGRVQGTTNSLGVVTLDVPAGSGMWIEINSLRLNRFYRLHEVPAVIDVQAVGYMTWRGWGQP